MAGMIRHTRLRRPAGAAAGLVALSLALTACGGNDGNTAAASASATPTPTATISVTPQPLQKPTTQSAVLDGDEDALTTYTNSHTPGVAFAPEYAGATRGFQRLCIGAVDVVSSSRSMTPTEYAQCKADGLDPVQIQVGADAVVLAIKSQTDVGADCLSTDQLKAAFEQGSTVTRWSQLGGGLDDAPFSAGGPSAASDVAGFFASYILDDPDASSADFRDSYRILDTEQKTKDFVVGSALTQRLALRYGDLLRTWSLLRQQVVVDRQVLRGKNLEVTKAQANQRKGIRTKRSVRARAADDQRVREAFSARDFWLIKTHRAAAKYQPVNRVFQKVRTAYGHLRGRYGRVGVFSQGFYATYENQLRPFEIQISDGDGHPNCIFPSPTTILNGQYPLARQILLTTTTQALQRGEVASYLTAYVTNAQANANASGIVPLPDTVKNEELGWLEDPSTIPTFSPDSQGNLVAATTQEMRSASASPTAPTDVQPAR